MVMPPKIRKSEEILNDLRSTCKDIRDRIKVNSPEQLIGCYWAQMLMSVNFREDQEIDSDILPISTQEDKPILFALEYIHATIAAEGLTSDEMAFDQTSAGEILQFSSRAIGLCMEYALASSRDGASIFRTDDGGLIFKILSTWVMIRGKRFAVMEEEFFSYVLSPHDEALREIYGISALDFANAIQSITHTTRMGFDKAMKRMDSMMQKAGLPERRKAQIEDIASMPRKASSARESLEAISLIDDMFHGGLFNLSKHSKLPEKLLSDLSYVPGENTKFVDDSKISGTPFKTLPAMVKPLIKLKNGYYCTDPYFIKDSAYRSLQRALIHRKPEYRQGWRERQTRMSEAAFADLMSEHLRGAKVFTDVYYPIEDGQWAETDSVILIGDVLINVEAKAGATALAAPAENLERHIDNVRDLVLKAYKQSERFFKYLYSEPEVPIYKKAPDGKYVEITRIRHGEFRKAFPIGLTVESFAPFSALIKENDMVVAIEDKHGFISVSIDDLMVIRKLMRNTGEFLHYLDVRQSLGLMKNATLFDEMDHLGFYISNNRGDKRLQKIMDDGNHDGVWVDGMDQDILGPYFFNKNWPNVEKPSQEYPPKVLELLDAIGRLTFANWLEADSYIRDKGIDARKELEKYLNWTLPILDRRPFSYFGMSTMPPHIIGGEITVFVARRLGVRDSKNEIIRKAEAFALAYELDRVRLFDLHVTPDKSIAFARMYWVQKPALLRNDYWDILEDAREMKSRIDAHG